MELLIQMEIAQPDCEHGLSANDLAIAKESEVFNGLLGY
jgi:hypothetical protein